MDLAASTMFLNASSVSGQARVFRPQSGFTHSRSGPMEAVALSRSSRMAPTSGTWGLWTS